MAHVSDSVSVSQEHLVLEPLALKEGGKKNHHQSSSSFSDSASEVELKKKRLLEELESFIPSSLVGIQVIDETALVGSTFPLPPVSAGNAKKSNKQQSRRRTVPMKKNNNNNNNKKEQEQEKENTTVIAAAAADYDNEEVGVGKEEIIKKTAEGVAKSKPKSKCWCYSRKEMEAVRYVNIGKQRKLWKSIYQRLKSEVGNEYETLAAAHPLNQKHYPPHCLPNNKPAPPILGVGAANGRWRCVNVFVH